MRVDRFSRERNRRSTRITRNYTNEAKGEINHIEDLLVKALGSFDLVRTEEELTTRIYRIGKQSKEGRVEVNKSGFVSLAFVMLLASLTTMAQEKHIIKPQTVISKIVEGMPKGDKQQVRVLTATFQPRDQTLFHTHRFPVTVYVLEGAFTLEKEGKEPVTVKTGQAMLMAPNVRMTGYNKSSTDPLRLVIFYVSDPNTPFLDAIH